MTIKKAKEVLNIEAQSIKALVSRLDAKFNKAVSLMLKCKGRVVITGMGKAGIIGRKISATLSSTGTPSLWMHSAEAIHGDLGQITKKDILILISNSGETDEVKRIIPLVKKIGATLIALTGNVKSSLAKHSDVVLDVSVKQEGCPLGLAPMASTTTALAMGDALAASLIVRKKFKTEQFAMFHPGGALGRKLILRVEDLMRTGSSYARVKEGQSVKNVLLAITKARCGSACVLSNSGKFVGIFTDGDLRRHAENDGQILKRKVKDVMTVNPTCIVKDQLASEALSILKLNKIDEVPVVDGKGKLVGLIDVQDLLRAGIV